MVALPGQGVLTLRRQCAASSFFTNASRYRPAEPAGERSVRPSWEPTRRLSVGLAQATQLPEAGPSAQCDSATPTTQGLWQHTGWGFSGKQKQKRFSSSEMCGGRQRAATLTCSEQRGAGWTAAGLGRGLSGGKTSTSPSDGETNVTDTSGSSRQDNVVL